jgi:DNA-binding Lrp family transcriptional regulator
VDPDDVRLTRAVQLAPRASFARLAAALGTHERTAARRYRRLVRAGTLRVVGTVNPVAAGSQLWQVRVRCRPDGAEALATALAAQPDITWAGVTAAGSEVFFAIRSLSGEWRDHLLTRSLPRTAQVLDIDARLVLHVHRGLSPQGWSALAGALTPAESALLTPTAPGDGDARIEAADAAFVRVLAEDGRAGIARLAAAAGISEGRAARRLTALLDARALVIDVDLDHAAYGHPVGAHLHCTVAPAHLPAVGAAVAAFPETGFAAATSGRDNLTAAVACRDLPHLYELSTTRLAALPGLHTVEVVPFSRVLRQS